MSRDLEQVGRDLETLGRSGVRRIVKQILAAGALQGENLAKTGFLTAGLHSRSGRLWSSIGGKVRNAGDNTELVLHAGGGGNAKNVRYAGVHEGLNRSGQRVSSTTILPKNGKYLRIPLGPAKTGAGNDRYQGPLRTMAPDKFDVVRSSTGNYLLVPKGKEGAKSSKLPWYLLVPSVTVPARPFLKPAMDRVRPAVAKALLQSLVNGAMGKG